MIMKWFSIFNFRKRKKIELGTLVSFKTRLGEESGIVKGFSNNKARVVSYSSHSSFSQWVPLHRLNIID